MEPKILRLGSIYFNDNPVEVGAIYKNEALSLGDTGGNFNGWTMAAI